MLKTIVRQGKRHRCQAFTLIEVTIVLLIIGFALALAAPPAIRKLDKAKLLSDRVADFYVDMGEYPAKLEDLINNPGNAKWDGPYLKKKKLPVDPWGEPYVYIYPGQHGDFDILSYGRDKSPGGEKNDADITSWE